jgi:hypothetical protein
MQIENEEDRRRFIVAGRATVTVVSKATGTRFTYKVSAPRSEGPDAKVRFVGVLSGPDNTSDYRYLGYLRKQGGGWQYCHGGRKARITEVAPSAKAFEWFWRHADSPKVEVLHAGRCGRCNRQLTVPESIETGLGPVCAEAS